jgi:hypothetical protein
MPERAIDGDGREVTSGFGSSNLWLTRCWSKGDSKSRSHPECGTLAPSVDAYRQMTVRRFAHPACCADARFAVDSPLEEGGFELLGRRRPGAPFCEA